MLKRIWRYLFVSVVYSLTLYKNVDLSNSKLRKWYTTTTMVQLRGPHLRNSSKEQLLTNQNDFNRKLDDTLKPLGYKQATLEKHESLSDFVIKNKNELSNKQTDTGIPKNNNKSINLIHPIRSYENKVTNSFRITFRILWFLAFVCATRFCIELLSTYICPCLRVSQAVLLLSFSLLGVLYRQLATMHMANTNKADWLYSTFDCLMSHLWILPHISYNLLPLMFLQIAYRIKFSFSHLNTHIFISGVCMGILSFALFVFGFGFGAKVLFPNSFTAFKDVYIILASVMGVTETTVAMGKWHKIMLAHDDLPHLLNIESLIRSGMASSTLWLFLSLNASEESQIHYYIESPTFIFTEYLKSFTCALSVGVSIVLVVRIVWWIATFTTHNAIWRRVGEGIHSVAIVGIPSMVYLSIALCDDSIAHSVTFPVCGLLAASVTALGISSKLNPSLTDLTYRLTCNTPKHIKQSTSLEPMIASACLTNTVLSTVLDKVIEIGVCASTFLVGFIIHPILFQNKLNPDVGDNLAYDEEKVYLWLRLSVFIAAIISLRILESVLSFFPLRYMLQTYTIRDAIMLGFGGIERGTLSLTICLLSHSQVNKQENVQLVLFYTTGCVLALKSISSIISSDMVTGKFVWCNKTSIITKKNFNKRLSSVDDVIKFKTLDYASNNWFVGSIPLCKLYPILIQLKTDIFRYPNFPVWRPPLADLVLQKTPPNENVHPRMPFCLTGRNKTDNDKIKGENTLEGEKKNCVCVCGVDSYLLRNLFDKRSSVELFDALLSYFSLLLEGHLISHTCYRNLCQSLLVAADGSVEAQRNKATLGNSIGVSDVDMWLKDIKNKRFRVKGHNMFSDNRSLKNTYSLEKSVTYLVRVTNVETFTGYGEQETRMGLKSRFLLYQRFAYLNAALQHFWAFIEAGESILSAEVKTNKHSGNPAIEQLRIAVSKCFDVVMYLYLMDPILFGFCRNILCCRALVYQQLQVIYSSRRHGLLDATTCIRIMKHVEAQLCNLLQFRPTVFLIRYWYNHAPFEIKWKGSLLPPRKFNETYAAKVIQKYYRKFSLNKATYSTTKDHSKRPPTARPQHKNHVYDERNRKYYNNRKKNNGADKTKRNTYYKRSRVWNQNNFVNQREPVVIEPDTPEQTSAVPTFVNPSILLNE